jgi:hypothetical protein
VRRVTLWLRKSAGRKDEPEYFIRDFADMDDVYQKGRFNNRTFSEDDKFEEGVFLTNEELTAFKREAFEAALDMIDCDGRVCDWKPPTFEDYQQQQKAVTDE